MRDRPDIKYAKRSDPPERNGKPKRSPGFTVLNHFNDTVKRTLRGSEIAVWLSLWRNADRKTNLVKMSVSAMSEECGFSYRQTQRALKSLRELKLIVIVRQGKRDHSAAVYRLIVPEDDGSKNS